MGTSLKGKELGVGISQRKDGIYQARFTNRFGIRETLYAKNLNNLRMQLRKAQSDNDNAINVARKDVTLDQWYEIWISTCKTNCRNSTLIEYGIKYNAIKKELGWRKVHTLTPLVLQKALNGLKSNQQRKGVKVILNDMLDKAQQNNLIVNNPAKHLTTKIGDEIYKEKRVLSIKETELFLEYAKNCQIYNLFVVALETGMRIGELRGLFWGDIDFEKRSIYVNRTMCYINGENGYYFEIHSPKTSSGKRLIPLTSKCMEALARQKLIKEAFLRKCKNEEPEFADLVFTTKKNQPILEISINKSISAILNHMRQDGINIKEFRPHAFRHTFATRAIENGMNPKTLQKILGHSTLQMTMDLYCHVTDDTLFEEMKKMDK